jgi:hypothetical protein
MVEAVAEEEVVRAGGGGERSESDAGLAASGDAAWTAVSTQTRRPQGLAWFMS